ncbi:hypothetical protein HY994_00880 [Candidatus Micrarchaeota archaeon]|nr:hypothetical protein [Candidatus Micrarchaeota archaeon]
MTEERISKTQSEEKKPTRRLLSDAAILKHTIKSIFGSPNESMVFRNKYGRKAYLSILQAHLEQKKWFAEHSMTFSSKGGGKKQNPVIANTDPREDWLHDRGPGKERYVAVFESALASHPAMREVILESDNPWKTAEIIFHNGSRIVPTRYNLAAQNEGKIINILAKLAKNEQDIKHIGNILHEGDETNPENHVPEGINGLVYLIADEHKATVHQWLNLIRLAKQKRVSIQRVRAHAHDSGIESAFEELRKRKDM